MTETEWLRCEDPPLMLAFLQGKTSDRKLRPFAVACCRRILHPLPEAWSRQAVEAAERYTGGMSSEEQLAEAGRRAGWGQLRSRFALKMYGNAADLEADTDFCHPVRAQVPAR